jgi:hypothetical protein
MRRWGSERLPETDAGWIARLAAPAPPPDAPVGSAQHRLWKLYARPNVPERGWWRLIEDLHERLVALDPTNERRSSV